MRRISNTTGSFSFGEVSWETGDIGKNFGNSTETKNKRKELIAKANTVPLTRIFDFYRIKIEDDRYNITCPFKSHKGGRESTPSFKYFADSNSYHCYGCRAGNSYTHAVEFVASMEGISIEEAAFKVLELFQDDVGAINQEINSEEFEDKFTAMMLFSNEVKEFRNSFYDIESIKFIDEVCKAYDRINFERVLTIPALNKLTEVLLNKINDFKLKRVK